MEKVWDDLFNPSWSGADKLIRNGVFYRALASRDHALLKKFLVDYWVSDEGKAFHDDFRYRFETHFLKHSVRATDDFAAHLEESSPPDQCCL